MRVVRVCLVRQDPEKKAQPVSVEKNPTPSNLLKLAASKLKVKIPKAKKKKGDAPTTRLVAMKSGKEIQNLEDISALEAMECLVLVRPGEEYCGATTTSTGGAPTNTTTHSIQVEEDKIAVFLPKYGP